MINNNNNYITGAAGYTVSASYSSTLREVTDSTSTTGTFPYNNTYRGVLASTTGNVYGIYDMSGGSYEYVAGNLKGYIAAVVPVGMFETIYKGSDTALKNKYFDLYAVGTAPGTNTSNYAANLDKKGDAMVEISTDGTGSTSWFSDISYFAQSTGSWVVRGGSRMSKIDAGVFAFESKNASSGVGAYSFRPVLSIK